VTDEARLKLDERLRDEDDVHIEALRALRRRARCSDASGLGRSGRALRDLGRDKRAEGLLCSVGTGAGPTSGYAGVVGPFADPLGVR
jgi:hypothetical protein